MKIRRERLHQSGLTNVDFRSKGELDKVDYFQGTLKYSDFGTMSRTAYGRNPSATNFKEQVAISGGWLNSKYKNQMFKNPRYETATAFYVGKKPEAKPYLPQAMSRGKEASLQNMRWSDRIFTGDTVKATANQALLARQRDYDAASKSETKGRRRTVDHRHVTERLFPAKQIKESDPTNLEDQVDLTRVRDARRALRRKYAARNNIDPIFDKYDAGAKGFIDAHDLLKQAKQIGVGISLDEAQVLIASAKMDEKESADVKLSIEEYANLLFSQEDKLQVSLKNLKPSDTLPTPLSHASQRSLGAPTELSAYQEASNLFDDDYVVLD